MRNFIDAGFDVFDTHPLTPHGWVGEDEYDYSATDARIEQYLSQKPDALLILRFWMEYDQANPRPGYGLWWQEKHADQRVMISTGPASGHLKNEPSFASLAWREAAGEALRRVVAHVEEKYGDNILGYVPGGGPCGEWYHWFCYGGRFSSDRLDDYSEPMRQAFVGAMREKYGDIAALNDAWSTSYESFEQIQIPGPEARNNALLGNMRSEKRERQVLDYLEIYNRQTADTLLHFARMTKQGCAGRKVVFAFYGYAWHHQAGSVAQSRGGHIHLDRVLACPDIDYLVSPFHYSFRQVGGVISGQAPVTPAILHGKQYLHELDGSTNLKSSWPSPHDNVPHDAAETGQLLRRDLARTITQGASAWYMDLVSGMYDSPSLVAELKTVLDAGRSHALRAGRSNAQVAVVLRPEDVLAYREDEPLLTPLISMFKQFHLERMGLGYDELLLSDLMQFSTEQTSRYRLWIFPSLAQLSDEELAAICVHCCRNGNHVLFNHAVGVSHGEGIDVARMRRITGFDCAYTLEAGELAVRTLPAAHPLLDGVRPGTIFGTYGDPSPEVIRHHAALKGYPQSFQITPRFWIRSGGKILGETIDFGDQPRGGLAIGERDGWVPILSVAPMLPREILRNIARAAGCHVYTDHLGQVFHCDGYLGMYFHEGGKCTMRLPSPARVCDVFDGRVIAEHADTFSIEARENTTVLFQLS